MRLKVKRAPLSMLYLNMLARGKNIRHIEKTMCLIIFRKCLIIFRKCLIIFSRCLIIFSRCLIIFHKCLTFFAII